MRPTFWEAPVLAKRRFRTGRFSKKIVRAFRHDFACEAKVLNS